MSTLAGFETLNKRWLSNAARLKKFSVLFPFPFDIMAPKQTNDPNSTMLLGVPDGAISAADDTDPYITKLGGLPVRFDKVSHCFTNVSFNRSG